MLHSRIQRNGSNYSVVIQRAFHDLGPEINLDRHCSYILNPMEMFRVENVCGASEHYWLISVSRQDRSLPVQVVHQIDIGRHAITCDILKVVQALYNQCIYSTVSHQSLQLVHIKFREPLPINLSPTNNIS